MSKIIRIPKGASSEKGVIEKAQPGNSGPFFGQLTGSRWSTLAPDVGYARLTADDDPALTVICELGDAAPLITQGYGGWEEVDRPGRESITTWRGFKPLAIDLPILLDDHAAGRSVEPSISILEALAGRGKLRTGGRPPLVVVHTSGVMPYDAQDYPDLRWVIQTLDFDETETIVNDHGNRVRAPVAVSLLQYVTDDRLQDAAFQARALIRARRGGGARRRYTVKEGETLVSIARRELGDGGRWPEIAHLNRDLRDPRSVHAGTVINLPR
jgi:hypothetical protein